MKAQAVGNVVMILTNDEKLLIVTRAYLAEVMTDVGREMGLLDRNESFDGFEPRRDTRPIRFSNSVT